MLGRREGATGFSEGTRVGEVELEGLEVGAWDGTILGSWEGLGLGLELGLVVGNDSLVKALYRTRS